MKLCISFRNMKFVIATAFLALLCNVCIHLLQAFRISHRNAFFIRNRSFQTLPISDVSTSTTLSYETYSPESGVRSQAKLYRWEIGTVECTHRDVANVSSDKGSLLPLKYARITWPPSSYAMCGEGDLLTPRSLEEVRKFRSTWGSVASFKGKLFSVVFLIGLPNASNHSELWQKALQEENAVFGDILQCPVSDTYKNLPNKVIHSLLWIIQHTNTETFYTFTDNDCMMKISNIHAFFDQLLPSEANENIFCGFNFNSKGTPVRQKKNKWFVDEDQYSHQRYPTFCHGGMYTMKGTLVRSILCASEITNITHFPLEDVLITGILREKLGNSTVNVKPVLTPSGRKYEVMYYPWDGAQPHVVWKMNRKWKIWNHTLHQFEGKYSLKTRRYGELFHGAAVHKLLLFWGSHAV